MKELQDLLNPISCEEFVNSYFGRRSVFVEGGPEKIGDIFSWEKLDKALERGAKIQDKRYNIMASFARGEDTGSSKQMVEAIHPAGRKPLQARRDHLHHEHPHGGSGIGAMGQTIRSQINFFGHRRHELLSLARWRRIEHPLRQESGDEHPGGGKEALEIFHGERPSPGPTRTPSTRTEASSRVERRIQENFLRNWRCAKWR